jgi:hypothetical protein
MEQPPDSSGVQGAGPDRGRPSNWIIARMSEQHFKRLTPNGLSAEG